jgi:hypothetical protein
LEGIPQKISRAYSFMEKGEYLAAKTIYETILKIRPDHKEAKKGIENLNTIQQTSGRNQGFTATPQSLEIEAKAFFSAGEWNLAMAKYAEILTKDSQNKTAQQGIKACMTELDKQNKHDNETDDKKVETPQEVINDIPPYKVFNPASIWIGTFMGGPLIAGYIIANNFKAFKDTQKVISTWIITVIFLIFFLIVIFSFPWHPLNFYFFFPIFYTSVAWTLMLFFQKENIDKHIGKGGKIHSYWRSAGIGIIGLFIIQFLIGFVEGATNTRTRYLDEPTVYSVPVDTVPTVDTSAVVDTVSYYK